MPTLAPWSLGALLVNHALITAAGLWPRSDWLGANMTRLPEALASRGAVALTLDDGPDPDITPHVLDLLERRGARATFFCIAERAARHPALTREIVRRGHSVQNHSARHRHNFSLLGPRGFRDEVSRAQAMLADITGILPTFFRAPAGLRNPFLDPVLHAQGLQLVSWTRRGFDTRASEPAPVLARLTRGLRQGDILLLHDGHAGPAPGRRPVVLDVLPPLLERCAEDRLMLVTLDGASSATTLPEPIAMAA